MQKINTQQSGYSLIEIIIGIVVALTVVMLATVAYQSHKKKTELGQISEGVVQVKTAVTTLHNTGTSYNNGSINPETLEAAGLTPQEWTVTGSGVGSKWNAPLGGTTVSMSLNPVLLGQIELTIDTTLDYCANIATQTINFVFNMEVNGTNVKGGGPLPTVKAIMLACEQTDPPNIKLNIIR